MNLIFKNFCYIQTVIKANSRYSHCNSLKSFNCPINWISFINRDKLLNLVAINPYCASKLKNFSYSAIPPPTPPPPPVISLRFGKCAALQICRTLID